VRCIRFALVALVEIATTVPAPVFSGS